MDIRWGGNCVPVVLKQKNWCFFCCRDTVLHWQAAVNHQCSGTWRKIGKTQQCNCPPQHSFVFIWGTPEWTRASWTGLLSPQCCSRLLQNYRQAHDYRMMPYLSKQLLEWFSLMMEILVSPSLHHITYSEKQKVCSTSAPVGSRFE